MGQYYRPILGDNSGLNCKVFDRSVDGEYTLAKLMEHSWWLNPFCNSFAEKIFKRKGRMRRTKTLTSNLIMPFTFRMKKKFGAKPSNFINRSPQTLRSTINFC